MPARSTPRARAVVIVSAWFLRSPFSKIDVEPGYLAAGQLSRNEGWLRRCFEECSNPERILTRVSALNSPFTCARRQTRNKPDILEKICAKPLLPSHNSNP